MLKKISAAIFLVLLTAVAQAQLIAPGPGSVPGVQGPSSVTSGDIATFSGTSGKVLQDGGAPPLSMACTPTLIGRTTAGSNTLSVATCRYSYTVLSSGGASVCVNIQIVTSALSGSAGIVEIGGLPYPVANVANYQPSWSFGLVSGITLSTGYVSLLGYSNANESVIILNKNNFATGTQSNVTWGTDTLAANTYIGVSGCYLTGVS